MQILPSEDFRKASKQFAAMMSRLVSDRPSDAFFESSHREIWTELNGGGWHLAGHGPNGASLLELAELSRVWGRHLVPLPFVESTLTHRWLDESVDGSLLSAPLTFAVGEGASRIVPFAALEDARLLSGADPQVLMLAHDARWDDDGGGGIAPSFPLTRLKPGSQVWGPTSATECSEYAALLCAQTVGAAEIAFEMAVEYANVREQFGRQIGKFQAVRHRLSDMYRDIQFARTGVIFATQVISESMAASIAVCHLSRSVIEGSIQVHGGIGFTWELGLHFYLRHVQAAEKVIRTLDRQTG